MDRVIRNATGMLRYAHAACFVTGNLRDDHVLLDMGSSTKRSLDKAGCKLLNSGVYATPLVSASLGAATPPLLRLSVVSARSIIYRVDACSNDTCAAHRSRRRRQRARYPL